MVNHLSIQTSQPPRWWFIPGILLLASFYLSFSLDGEIFFVLGLVVIVVAISAIIDFEKAFLFIPIALTNPYALKETGSNLHISELILIVIFLVWGLRQVCGAEKLSLERAFLVPALFVVVTSIVSLVNAKYLIAGGKQVVRHIEVLLVLFLLAYNYCDSKKQIRSVFLALMVGGLLASIVGISQFIFDSELAKGGTRRVFGWAGGVYGAMIGSTLIFCITTLLHDRDAIYRRWSLITIPFASIALLLSQTRAWIAAFILSIFIVLLLGRRKDVPKIILALLSTILVVVVFVETDAFGLVDGDLMKSALDHAFRFGTTPGVRSSEDLSLFLRLTTWRFAIDLFLANPIFGIGAGGLRFVQYFPPRMGQPDVGVGYVDNEFIQIFTEAGFVAGLSWTWLMYFAVREGSRAVKNTRGTDFHSIAIGLFGGLLLVVIGGLFWVITSSHEMYAIMILIVALLLNITKHFKFPQTANVHCEG